MPKLEIHCFTPPKKPNTITCANIQYKRSQHESVAAKLCKLFSLSFLFIHAWPCLAPISLSAKSIEYLNPRHINFHFW